MNGIVYVFVVRYDIEYLPFIIGIVLGINAKFISSLPFTIFFTEWYLTAFIVRDWAFSTARDELLLGIAYLCFTFSLLTVVPTNKKRLFSLLYGLLISIILIQLIQAEIIVNPYEKLLNI